MEEPGTKASLLVVVAVDESPHSLAAFQTATAVFGKGALYHIIHVRPAEETLALEGLSEAYHQYAQNMEQQREQQSRKVLGKFRALAQEDSLRHTTVELRSQASWRHPRGDPREEICRYCAEVGAAVLVLGSRGTGAVSRALLGSVSNHCAHHARCSVLVHRSQTKGSPTSKKGPGTSSGSLGSGSQAAA